MKLEQEKLFTDLTNNVKIGKGRHVRMGPCVHSDIVVSFERILELIGTAEDVHADHKMSGSLIVRLQKVNKPGRELRKL